MTKIQHWNGEPLKHHEDVYLAFMRASDYMFCRTLDNQSKHWMVISPEMTNKPVDIWYPYVFSDYSTPGKPGGHYIRKNWRNHIKEQVSKYVYHIGMLNSKWEMYVCEGFPDNKIMLGMGYKEVVRFRKEGMKQYDWGEYPNLVPYMGKPTINNYSIITLDSGRDKEFWLAAEMEFSKRDGNFIKESYLESLLPGWTILT